MTYTTKADALTFDRTVSSQSRREWPRSHAVEKPSVRTRNPGLTPPKLGPVGYFAGPLVLIVVWEFASLAGWISPRQLAAPSTAITTGYAMIANGQLLDHLFASAIRAYSGLGIGVVLGVIAALAAGLTRVGDAAIDGLVQIKRAIPTLALIPLVLLWLGIGEAMKIAVIATSVFVPIYINTHSALRGIDIRFVELAQTLGLTRLEFVRRVALPAALSGFFTGLRLAVTTCWTALVVLEQINATQGIGYIMSRARDYGQTDVIVLGIATYAILGLTSDVIVRAVERHVLAYRRVLGS
jgi:sulfonate transport system permease protein